MRSKLSIFLFISSLVSLCGAQHASVFEASDEDELLVEPDLTNLKKTESSASSGQFHTAGSSSASWASKDCCDKPIIITSVYQQEGYLIAPPMYDEMNEHKNYKKTIECMYKFYGKPNERIQLFYEDFDLYYPYDIYKFYKIE